MVKDGTALGVRITQMLAERGVKHIFGIPGVHNQELYRGLPGSGITHVLARHEQGAGFMADGYARATGRPGIAYIITGPGLLNILTPLGQAYSDSVPVLAISSCLDDAASRRGQLHQMLDQRGAGATVTASSDEALSSGSAYRLIDRALGAFELDRPGPRHIQIPIQVLEAAADPAPAPRPSPSRPAGSDQLNMVASAINDAKRPLFIFGGGARFEGVQTLIADLLAKSGAGAFTSYAGRGLIAPDHPQFFGSYLGQEGSISILEQADIVIAVGTELSECDLWRDQLGHKAQMVRVDIDVEVLFDRHMAEIPVQAEAGEFLTNLVPLLDQRTTDPAWTASEVAAARTSPLIHPICG